MAQLDSLGGFVCASDHDPESPHFRRPHSSSPCDGRSVSRPGLDPAQATPVAVADFALPDVRRHLWSRRVVSDDPGEAYVEGRSLGGRDSGDVSALFE